MIEAVGLGAEKGKLAHSAFWYICSVGGNLSIQLQGQHRQHINLITADLVDEMDDSSRLIFPPSQVWTSVKFKQAALDMIARLSSRVFSGLDLCRNHITRCYPYDHEVSVVSPYEHQQKL